MRHFAHLPEAEHERLFLRRPQTFSADSPVALLGVALGATLYLPGTRPALAADVSRQAALGARSMVLCLEDAVADRDVASAEDGVVAALRTLHDAGFDDALLFVRVRAAEQVGALVERLGPALRTLAGFVLPKFPASSSVAGLDAVADASAAAGRRLLVMPVLEAPEVVHRESRRAALEEAARLLAKHRESVPAVRIGATDLCGAYGIRRARDLTIWDVRVVADLIGDVVNVLGRADEDHYVITGPVWEYYGSGERLLKPQLRETPFEAHGERRLRRRLLADDLDGLIREVELDRSNGLTGKTVIHPRHVSTVHALSTVSHEEWCDARDIVGDDGGGVLASGYRNKMNELRPHRAWAQRTLQRARAFGVAREDVTFVDLLAACEPPPAAAGS